MRVLEQSKLQHYGRKGKECQFTVSDKKSCACLLPRVQHWGGIHWDTTLDLLQ